jgi:hypothetical protein
MIAENNKVLSGEAGYFTKAEIASVKLAMSHVSGVGININSYVSSDPQLKTFFDKAKLWRVVKNIISALYIERLAAGKMFLKDDEGNEYKVVRVKGVTGAA